MRGILMTPDNIKATMELRKGQTRRLSGLELVNESPGDWYLEKNDIGGLLMCNRKTGGRYGVADKLLGKPYAFMPRYFPGETVYVKEAYKIIDVDLPEEFSYPTQVEYKDGTKVWITRPLSIPKIMPDKWFSPMFMPEWAARTFLLIKDVRPELYRLANMTKEDIKAEGGESAIQFLQDYEGKWVWRIVWELIKK